jgi:hypothetical protein
MDGFLRKITPVVLVLLGLFAWLEPMLVGDRGVLRVAVCVLCFYTAMLIFERQRMEMRFGEVLGSFKQFYSDRSAGAGSVTSEKGLEAVRILVAALDSPEEEVRQTAYENLKLLTGNDFGLSLEGWSRWLEKTHGLSAQKDS